MKPTKNLVVLFIYLMRHPVNLLNCCTENTLAVIWLGEFTDSYQGFKVVDCDSNKGMNKEVVHGHFKG